jgi:hypothetical protein
LIPPGLRPGGIKTAEWYDGGMATLRTGATDPQIRFHNSDHRFRGFVSGVGAGKTWAGAVEVLRQPAGSVGVVAAPTFRMLEDATIATFYEVAQKFVIPESRRQYQCELINGTKVLFRSADDPERMRGPNLGWFWLDEAAMMEPLIWEIMIGRLRKDPGRGWITTTPKGTVNWIYKVFVLEKTDDVFLVQCRTDSNVFLPDFFIDSLNMRYTGAWKKQEFEGEFVNFGEHLAYHDYRSNLNLHRHPPQDPAIPGDHPDSLIVNYYDPRKELAICCDFNVAIMSWPCVQVHQSVTKPKAQPMVLTELTTLGRASVRAQCDLIRQRFPEHTAPLVFYGDASGQGGSSQTGLSHYDLIEEELFRQYDLRFMLPKKNPRPLNRIITVNDVLRGTGCWEPLLVDQQDCPVFIRDLEACVMNERGDDVLKVKDPNDERYYMTHSTDGFGYFTTMEVPLAAAFVASELDEIRKNVHLERGMDTRHGVGLRGV